MIQSHAPIIKAVIITLTIMVGSIASIAQSEKHSSVKIYANELEVLQLSRAGVAMDHVQIKKGLFVIAELSESELQIVESLGIPFDVLIDDMSEFYRNRNLQDAQKSGGRGIQSSCDVIDYATPSNFVLGTMGGYYTYTEFLAQLDSMASKFPTLIKPRTQIGTFLTVESRPIYWLKISDNPNVDEPEPEILYTALHHAREPASLSQLIFYMWYLLENYGVDDQVTQLIQNTEMYFIPMVNPDGYSYNESTNPTGGGMWRKNRRNNGSNYGVDLNRNYGHQWGYDNLGSSGSTSSSTYRGPSAFSEVETQATKFFCENHDFKIALNYHCYGDLLIYPWGYLLSYYTPDSAQFAEYGRLLTKLNSYNFGTGDQTVGYVTNGDSDDWMYGEQISKNKIFSFTPEAGKTSDGFWPVASKITDICKVNIYQNLLAATLVGKYAEVTDTEPLGVETAAGFLNFEIQRFGMEAPGTYTVSVVPLGTGLASVGPPKAFASLGVMQTQSDSIAFTLDASIQSGDYFSYVLEVDNGNFVMRDTVKKLYAPATAIFTEMGNSVAQWSAGGWGASGTHFYSASSSITDSPIGNYNDNETNEIELSNPIDITTADGATLSFWARWDIELGYDYAQLMISADGGVNWEALCGRYTVTGNSDQDEGEPLYHGYQTDWVREYIDISDYVGNAILLKFRMVSDGFATYDGFYYDDLVVQQLNGEIVFGTEEEVIQKPTMQLSPNPANEFVDLKWTGEGFQSVVITNSAGQQLMSEKLNRASKTVRLNTGKLDAGVYFVQVRSNMSRSEIQSFTITR